MASLILGLKKVQMARERDGPMFGAITLPELTPEQRKENTVIDFTEYNKNSEKGKDLSQEQQVA